MQIKYDKKKLKVQAMEISLVEFPLPSIMKSISICISSAVFKNLFKHDLLVLFINCGDAIHLGQLSVPLRHMCLHKTLFIEEKNADLKPTYNIKGN